MARGIGADQKLRIEVELETRGLVKGTKEYKAEMAKLISTTRKANRSTTRQQQGFTQLAYALDDVQYGFRGIQNNIQALAVQLGVAGPVVLGITAAGVALNQYFSDPKRVQQFFSILKTELGNATDALKKYTKELRKLQEIELTQDQKIVLSAQNQENAAKKTLKLLLEKQKTNKVFFQQLKDGTIIYRDLTKAEKDAQAAEIQNARDAIFDAQAAKADAIERIRLLEIQKRKEKELADQRKKDKEFKDSRSKGFKFDTGGLGFFGTGFNTIIGNLPTAQQAFADFGLGISSSFQSLTGSLGTFADEFSQKLYVAKKETKDAAAEIARDLESLNAQLATIVAGGIADFASALGEALVTPKDLGKKLLDGIGKLMIAFGTALIAWGAGWKFFKEAPANPVGAIVGGVALVAAGAAISAVASKASAFGGGASSASAASAASSRITPSSTQGFGFNGSLISTVRGQDLRFVLEGANDSYSGRN